MRSKYIDVLVRSHLIISGLPILFQHTVLKIIVPGFQIVSIFTVRRLAALPVLFSQIQIKQSICVGDEQMQQTHASALKHLRPKTFIILAVLRRSV